MDRSWTVLSSSDCLATVNIAAFQNNYYIIMEMNDTPHGWSYLFFWLMVCIMKYPCYGCFYVIYSQRKSQCYKNNKSIVHVLFWFFWKISFHLREILSSMPRPCSVVVLSIANVAMQTLFVESFKVIVLATVDVRGGRGIFCHRV